MQTSSDPLMKGDQSAVGAINKQLEEERPTSGRPQGSPLRTTLLPPLQRPQSGQWQIRVFVRAGVVRMSGWDPCGRPEVGLWPLNWMPMGRDKSATTGVRILVFISINIFVL